MVLLIAGLRVVFREWEVLQPRGQKYWGERGSEMGGKSSEGSSTFQIEGPIDGFLDFEPVEVG